jgi:cell division protease FtsH
VAWAAAAALIVLMIIALNGVEPPKRVDSLTYREFRDEVVRGRVESVQARGDELTGTYRPLVGGPEREFRSQRPSFATDDLATLLDVHGVTLTAVPEDDGGSDLAGKVLAFLPFLILAGILVLFLRSTRRGGLGGFGRAHPRVGTEGTKSTTFADVAGIDDARGELLEIVDYLRHPDRYAAIGATVPRGVLLYGPPGTGKTLLARAVAGEAAVPFFSLSASEFVELYVGVGASRVRDLFAQAKAAAPAIVFIDELDAVGRQRGAGPQHGSNDEREQTLNQILTELDGFTGSEGVIVLAATNRPELLDAALLRAGRFDRRVAVTPPDRAGRRDILAVHTRGMALATDVDLDRVAASTPGMVGADLRNLANEAALTAVRRGRGTVTADDFTEALERILLGAERRIVISKEERERTAVHEAGHALLGVLHPGADPVRKVSIVPHGQALGVTLQSPEADRYGETADYLRGRIVGTMGGRAAEEVVFGDLTTSAADDLEQATGLARRMVATWGMSPALGPVALDRRGDPFDPAAGLSEETRRRIDDEVMRIVAECHAEALRVIRGARPQLDALAAALLEHETLNEDEVYRIAQISGAEPEAAEAGTASL